MKILVIQLSTLGDIILATPVVRVLKTQLDDVEIHFICQLAYQTNVASNPYIDKVICLEEVRGKSIKKLREEKYDYLIDLNTNFTTQILKWKLGVKSFSFRELTLRQWTLIKLKINKLPSGHIVERYIAALASLKIKNDALGLDYFIDDKDTVPIDWLPETHRTGYVVFALSVERITMMLPLKKAIELCDKINRPIVLVGNKEDAQHAEAIRVFFERPTDIGYEEGLQALGKKTSIYNACGLFSINQSASLIKHSRCVFTYDSYYMHMAAAFKKEVFSVWGSTVPAFGKYPYRTKFTILEKAALTCRPCSKTGFDKCPKGHFKCMNDIVFDFYLP
jgi:ADP-heptose:LPS heptosyltransferase